MSKEPITISWDELKTRKVEQRINEQQAMARNRAYAKLDAEELPVATKRRTTILNHTIFIMAAMGFLGGLLAWSGGFLAHITPAEREALDLVHEIEHLDLQQDEGNLKPEAASGAIAAVREQGATNSYFQAIDQMGLSNDQRAARIAQVESRAQMKKLLLNSLSFGLAGMLLATCLGIAEPLSERNLPRAVRTGALGAVLGLIGGIIVSLFVDKLYRAAAGNAVPDPNQPLAVRDILARACAWGVLGLFLAAGPGLLMGNVKKTLAGLAGGLLGGAIGGALFDPINAVAGADVSRLLALCAIGAIAGCATGWIENAAKTGWLKVTGGLIAGKQFIIYRNPTYIGSAPDCQIYLFRDPNIGRRHAALHLIPGGIELEDLPLGIKTSVNGKPVSRIRLRHDDQITIGGTQFLFQEKNAGAKSKRKS